MGPSFLGKSSPRRQNQINFFASFIFFLFFLFLFFPFFLSFFPAATSSLCGAGGEQKKEEEEGEGEGGCRRKAAEIMDDELGNPSSSTDFDEDEVPRLLDEISAAGLKKTNTKTFFFLSFS